MKRNGSDILIDCLIAWGVDTIFGMPGDGINGVMEAIRKRQDRIRFIQVRHEESAALMACAHAKWTGQLGCCLATTGPGRHAPAERPVRRQVRPGLGDRDHRPAVSRPHRHLHAAGRRPAQAVRRRRRLQRAHHERGARRERDVARLPHRLHAARRGACRHSRPTCRKRSSRRSKPSTRNVQHHVSFAQPGGRARAGRARARARRSRS